MLNTVLLGIAVFVFLVMSAVMLVDIFKHRN